MPRDVVLTGFNSSIASDCLDLMTRVYGEVGYPPMPFDEWYGEVLADPAYDPTVMWAALTNHRVVGFCHCWRESFVKDLVVDRAWRGRGLGSTMLTLALETFAARGAAAVDLKTDLDNIRAQSLYRRLGFVIVERVDD
jgi:ribosomal protein S18 acetylase RimI-like enzyme